MRHVIAAILGAALVAALPAPARAACNGDPQDCAHAAFILENDSPTGRDRYYTNGFLFAWSSRAYHPPAWLSPLTGPAAGLVPAENLRWGLSLGQKMYTPEDTQTRNPDPEDRPYAGWLYGALTLISSGPRQLSSVELQIGVVGPSALGEEAQNGTHRLMRIPTAKGWDHQIKDEPGVNLVLSRQLRVNQATGFDDISVGVVPSFALSLGNVSTYASAGAMLRIGNALEADFGPPRVRPASAGSVFYESTADGGLGWYLFAGVEGRVVARDIALDGNTWRDSRSVDREWFVGDLSAGLALMYGEWRLTATYTARSQEFSEQRGAAQFASFSIARRF
jgi:lipid A 3-O-deacylase